MALKLTLKPNERILINGCIVRNSDRRQLLLIENKADVVREGDLLDENDARTPVKEVYYFVQAAIGIAHNAAVDQNTFIRFQGEFQCHVRSLRRAERATAQPINYCFIHVDQGFDVPRTGQNRLRVVINPDRQRYQRSAQIR